MQPQRDGISKTNQRWYPYKAHRKFYRLLAGKLVSCPMQPDGTMDEAETLQVDFDATQFEPPVDSKYVTLADELRPLFPTRNAKDVAVDFAEFSRINQIFYFHNCIGVEDIA